MSSNEGFPEFRMNTGCLAYEADRGSIKNVKEILEEMSRKTSLKAYDVLCFLLYKNDHCIIYSNISKILLERIICIAHIKNNYLLRTAILYGFTDIAIRLLAIEKVRRNAHANNNEALSRCIYWDYENLVLELIKIPSVRFIAHNNDNELLRLALKSNFYADTIIRALLTIKSVQNGLDSIDHKEYYICLRKYYYDSIMYLLKIQRYRNSLHKNGNSAMLTAIYDGHYYITKCLLKIKKIRKNAHVNDNEALKSAITYKYTDIVSLLLHEKKVHTSICKEFGR